MSAARGAPAAGDAGPRAASELRAWLAAHADEMVSLLVYLAGLESPSTDPASQGPVLDAIASALAPAGFGARRRSGVSSGGVLLATDGARRGGAPYQLLLGHSDTVWDHGTLRSMPVRVEGDIVRGPGTFDMKAGLVIAIFAIRALRELGVATPVRPALLVTSDEEVGSAESVRWIRRLARGADRVLVLEPAAGPDGLVKTARKGVADFQLVVHGRAAHAGLEPDAGASAIHEMAMVIGRVLATREGLPGVTLNVGLIEGGERPNVIAPECRAALDVRFERLADGEVVERRLRSLETRARGTRLEVLGGIDRPPLERTPRNVKLWELLRRRAEEIGICVEEAPIVGGASDGNLTSPLAPTIDGLGAVGAGAHAEHEHVLADSLPKRAALLAWLIAAPPIRDD
ncbi:MAG TPA: M20/M25/M40 family metallo-hydrolase [Longimicrobiales bacterium]|nr:M20/M25/M40 family metallo-hydrolase [Longimicrobiales bacterium]